MLFILNAILNLLLSSVLILSGCKYNFYANSNIYKINYPMIYIYSYDPCGYVTTVIKNKLRINNILYTDYKKDTEYKKLPYIALYILNSSERCVKTALFQNGESAEYQLVLTISLKIKRQNKECHSFNIKTFKSFFENPMIISSNFVKNNNIREMLYEEAAEELINKLCFYK